MNCKYCGKPHNNVRIGKSHEAACADNPDNSGLSKEVLYRKAQQYSFSAERWADNQGVPRKRAFIGWVNANIDVTKCKTVLIIGAADPTEKRILEELTGSTGILAIDLNAHHPEIIEMDMHSLDFPPDTFDLVIASHSLEHCLSPDEAIKQIDKVLKPGGYFTCEVPVNYPVNDVDRWDFKNSKGVAAAIGKEMAGTVVAFSDIPLGQPGNYCATDVAMIIVRKEE